MQYLLLIHSDEKAMQAATQEETGSMLAAYGAYMKAMADAGVSRGGQRLRPTRPQRPCGSRTARPRCSMALTPR